MNGDQQNEQANSVSRTTPVRCPFCGSLDTELYSLFGQQLLTVQYYCNACHTPFEHIKDDAILHEQKKHEEKER